MPEPISPSPPPSPRKQIPAQEQEGVLEGRSVSPLRSPREASPPPLFQGREGSPSLEGRVSPTFSEESGSSLGSVVAHTPDSYAWLKPVIEQGKGVHEGLFEKRPSEEFQRTYTTVESDLGRDGLTGGYAFEGLNQFRAHDPKEPFSRKSLDYLFDQMEITTEERRSPQRLHDALENKGVSHADIFSLLHDYFPFPSEKDRAEALFRIVFPGKGIDELKEQDVETLREFFIAKGFSSEETDVLIQFLKSGDNDPLSVINILSGWISHEIDMPDSCTLSPETVCSHFGYRFHFGRVFANDSEKVEALFHKIFPDLEISQLVENLGEEGAKVFLQGKGFSGEEIGAILSFLTSDEKDYARMAELLSHWISKQDDVLYQAVASFGTASKEAVNHCLENKMGSPEARNEEILEELKACGCNDKNAFAILDAMQDAQILRDQGLSEEEISQIIQARYGYGADFYRILKEKGLSHEEIHLVMQSMTQIFPICSRENAFAAVFKASRGEYMMFGGGSIPRGMIPRGEESNFFKVSYRDGVVYVQNECYNAIQNPSENGGHPPIFAFLKLTSAIDSSDVSEPKFTCTWEVIPANQP